MRRVRARRQGQGTLEYILILVVILLALIAAIPRFRATIVNQVFGGANTQLNRAGNALNAI